MKPLPQQRLLLELLTMSGDIAVPVDRDHTILWVTLEECKTKRWIKITEISGGIFKVEITDKGRDVIRDIIT